ncbi:MAG TPA: MmgE/PrpD family protein [Xanthobacteraceae bacterium]|nr:MmgE/PrpD family protein [Xanthobacteraceae bacterium]
MTTSDDATISKITHALAAYIAGSAERELPGDVTAKTKLHILDTLAAMLSGARLKPGELAAAYVESLGGRPEATVIGTPIITSAVNAALANGMMGHADETDDSHLGGLFHPGCAIVPAALAMAERAGRGGADLIRVVALGYDVGARIAPALGSRRSDTASHSTHSLGALFGATAAAAALLRLDAKEVRHALSYATQQASGVAYWSRDHEHIEKAFDFGGMGARNGVAAATMVAAGFTGVDDPLGGKHNLFTALGAAPAPDKLTAELGHRYEIMHASIKKWCVGSPIQAALDALTLLMAEHRLGADDVRAIVVDMPDDRLHIVDNRAIPDICLQYLLAVTLADGTLTFASAHDYARMQDPAVQALRARIEVMPSAELTAAVPARQAIVTIETTDGRSLRHRTYAVRGTPDNPMSQNEVEAKARDLMGPIIGAERADKLIAAVASLERLKLATELRPLLQA